MRLHIATQTALTVAQRRVLTKLRDEAYPDNEIVCSGVECWIGLERTSWAVVNALLGMTAISDVSDTNGGARRFVINETGERILDDESNIQRVVASLLKGGAWTWKEGRLVKMA